MVQLKVGLSFRCQGSEINITCKSKNVGNASTHRDSARLKENFFLTTDCLLCEMETVVIDIFSQFESYGFPSVYADKRVKLHPFVDRKYFID